MDRKHRALKNAPVVGGIVLAILLLVGAVWVIRYFMAMTGNRGGLSKDSTCV